MLVFLAANYSAFAGSHYTKMVESKPVTANGLEFIAATEDEWVCFNPPLGEDTLQVQLFIRNTTQAPLVFSIFDTFRIIIKDSKGNEIHGGFARVGG